MKLIGHRDILGMPLEERGLPDAAAQGFIKLLDEAYLSGKPYTADGAKYAMQADPGGPVDEPYVDFVFQPIRDAEGNVSGILVQGVDVTDRVLTEVRRDALNRLNRRSA